MDLKTSISSQIRKRIERIKRDKIIQETGVPDLEKKLAATKTSIYLKTMKMEEGGEAKESSSEVTSVIGIVGGFIIYIFILIYCTQVMRGVIEEKSNRIIEVIVSSVKPFQLMMGKIIGIAMVGLLQFLIWIVLSGIIVFAVQALLIPDLDIESIRQAGANLSAIAQNSNLDIEQAKVLSSVLKTIDPAFILTYLGAFLFYFIGGYLLYAALFAAIGAAVDNETETQQFMTPLAIVLAISLYMGFGVMRSPESSMAVWASIVPFTSPIVMLVRIPFGVPTIQLVSSIVLLIASFFALTWLSGKIYRVGILMYGKKITYKELWKWIKYKH
jgi:ABC-2 type transport system permease protein